MGILPRPQAVNEPIQQCYLHFLLPPAFLQKPLDFLRKTLIRGLIHDFSCLLLISLYATMYGMPSHIPTALPFNRVTSYAHTPCPLSPSAPMSPSDFFFA